MIKEIFIIIWKATGNPVQSDRHYRTYDAARKVRLDYIKKDFMEVRRFVIADEL